MEAVSTTKLAFQTLDWFLQRIGKRVFRNDNGCGCETCKDVSRNGIVIKSEIHAKYLQSVQGEMSLQYSDTK